MGTKSKMKRQAQALGIGVETVALDAFRRLLNEGAIRHDAHRTAFMTSDAPEEVHQARVALRRMRTLVRGFADMLSPKTAKRLAGLLADDFRRFGPLRDADVQAAALAGTEHEADLAAEAARLRHELREALAAENAPSLKARITTILHDTPRAVGCGKQRRLALAPVGLIASRALHVTWTGLLSFGPDLTALPPDELHEFRKRAKDMRYLTEFFSELFEESAEKMVKKMAQMQDALGLVNDLHVMRQGDSPNLPQNYEEQEAEALSEAQKAWKKLRGIHSWWLTIPQ